MAGSTRTSWSTATTATIASEAERAEWMDYFEALADSVIKPTIARRRRSAGDGRSPSSASTPAQVLDPATAPPKKYDILHVGHNWWRWKDVSGELLPAFEQIRDQVGEIGFLGLWWDGVPDWAARRAWSPPTASDTEAFRRLRIRVEPPVIYTDVIRTMSQARINIFTQRPVPGAPEASDAAAISRIFCADTIPLLMLEDDLAEAVYGPAGRELTLPGRAAEKILDALHRPDHYREVVEDVRRYMLTHHSFDQRVEELVALPD